jgi:acyl-CoA synthetase (AMP-forming)/AMP-acid ligase II
MSLHPSVHACMMPDKTAYRMAGSGAPITYGELDRVSNRGAQLFRSLGLQPRDHIALLAENSLHGDLLGGTALRALLHGDQHASDAGRDRLYRHRLRGQGFHHHRAPRQHRQ